MYSGAMTIGISLYRSSFIFWPAIKSNGIFAWALWLIQSLKSKLCKGIFLVSRSLVAMMYGLSLARISLASLRNLSKTFLSLPNTPLLMQSSTDAVFSVLSLEEVSAENARSTPTNLAKLAQLPAPPSDMASMLAPMTLPVPFSSLDGL